MDPLYAGGKAMSRDLMFQFQKNWLYDRQLTCDLIDCLSAKDIYFSPCPGLGPFWKQFRHLGRVQENYLEAISSGQIEFSTKNPTYAGGADGEKLKAYLKELDVRQSDLLQKTDPFTKISWFGEEVDMYEHMRRMHNHEILHHGQWIVYMKLAGKAFPDSWSVWGL